MDKLEKIEAIKAILAKTIGQKSSPEDISLVANLIATEVLEEHNVFLNTAEDIENNETYLCNCICGWIGSEFYDEESAEENGRGHLELMYSEDENDIAWRSIIGDI